MSSSALKLALEITALDAASSVLRRLGGEVTSFAKKADEVKRHFSDAWIEIGKGAAAMHYGLGAIRDVVKPAADLEEAMLNVRSNLGNASMDARELNAQMAKVADTADLITRNTRISKVDAVEIQNELLKGGLSQASVDGKEGAGLATATLATLAKVDPGTTAVSMVRIGSAFQLADNAYGALADTMVRVDDASAANTQQLVYGLQQSAASAHALGVSVKDAVVSLGVLAPLGEQAGTAYDRFLSDAVGKTPKARKQMEALGLATKDASGFHNKFFENGKFVGMKRAIDMVRVALSKIKGDDNKLLAMQNIFGTEGGRAALVFATATMSFESISKNAENSYSAQQKMVIAMGGMNAQAELMKNTFAQLAATTFDPLKASLTDLFKSVTQGLTDMNGLAKDHPGVTNTASVLAGGAAAGGGLYALWKLLKGGGSMVKGLRAMGGTAVGVAEGKALQAATGVTPVFVTNFAQMAGGGGVGGAAADVATGAVAGGVLKKLALSAGLLRAAPSMAAIAEMGASAVGVAAAAVVAAGAVGYGAGKVGMSFASDDFKDKIGGTIATIMAKYFNSDDAKEALNINLHIDGKQVATVVNAHNASQAKRH